PHAFIDLRTSSIALFASVAPFLTPDVSRPTLTLLSAAIVEVLLVVVLVGRARRKFGTPALQDEREQERAVLGRLPVFRLAPEEQRHDPSLSALDVRDDVVNAP